MVFTSAEPVPAGGPLRESMQTLARKLSKWASRVEKKYAVEVLFRGTEFTRLTAAERRMDDQYPPDTILYHVHANIVAWPRKAMRPIEWTEFLSSTWSKTKAHWRDNGKLQKPSEVIKYVIKPNCLQGASDKEIHWLYEQTQRLKISQPMGSFATFLARLELAHQKIARVNGPEQGALVRVQKATRLNHSSHEDTDEAADMVKPKSTCSRPPTNILLGMTLPCRRFSPWSEPLILVQRYEPKATSAGDIKRLSEIDADMQWARIKWDENDAPPPALALEIAARCRAGLSFDICEHVATSKPAAVADDYKVHTSRPTVQSQLVTKTSAAPPNIYTLSVPDLVASEIASQSRRVVGAKQFIAERLDVLQRDFVRFGGAPPPLLTDVARWLSRPDVALTSSKPIERGIAHLERDHTPGPGAATAVLAIAGKLRTRAGDRDGAPPNIVIEWRRDIQISPSKVNREPVGGHHA
jgi:hypothetical protein